MINQFTAQITGTVEAAYHNEPAPSDYINVSLERRGAMGDWEQVLREEVSITEPSAPVTFTVGVAGQYRVVCRRMSVSHTLMGPSAESPEVYLGSGTYAAPFSVTLTVSPTSAPSDDDLPF